MHGLHGRKDAPRFDRPGPRTLNDLFHEQLQAAKRPDAQHRGGARDCARAQDEQCEASGTIFFGLLVPKACLGGGANGYSANAHL
jgi:hypothetical protein